LPRPGSWEIPCQLFREDQTPPGPGTDEIGVILGEAFAMGMRAGEYHAGFRHTHIGWFAPDTVLEDARGDGRDWLARIEGATYRVILAQLVFRGPVPFRVKAWLYRLDSFGGDFP